MLLCSQMNCTHEMKTQMAGPKSHSLRKQENRTICTTKNLILIGTIAASKVHQNWKTLFKQVTLMSLKKIKDSLQNLSVSTVIYTLRKCREKKLRIYNKISYPYYQLKKDLIRAEITKTLVLAQLKLLQFGHEMIKICNITRKGRLFHRRNAIYEKDLCFNKTSIRGRLIESAIVAAKIASIILDSRLFA